MSNPDTTLNVSFRSRHFVLSPADQAAYNELLVAAFPDIRFYADPRDKARQQPEPPEIVLHRSFLDVEDRTVQIIFESDWTPEWKWKEDYYYYDYWSIKNKPGPNGYFSPSGKLYRDRSLDPPVEYLGGGDIHFRCVPGDKVHFSIANKALRLLTKIATNRCKRIRYPSMEVMFRVEKGGINWFGHDTIRWCRERPNRVLDWWDIGQVASVPLDE